MTIPSQDLSSGQNNGQVVKGNNLQLSPDLQSAKDESVLVQWCKKQYKLMKDARTPVERQWYLNLAFFYGRQNVQWMATTVSTNGFKLYTPQAPPWRVRLVINKVRAIVRAELAKITAQKPNFTVVPATTDDEDFVAARAAEQIFNYFYEGKKIQRVVKQAEWWTVVCGVGYMLNYWDQYSKDTVNNMSGDVEYEAITPFHVLVPNLKQQDIEKQPYIIYAQTQTVDWINARYKTSISGQKVTPNVKATDDIIEDAFLNMIGAKSNINNEVLVLEVWIKPQGHPQFPDGGLITVVGDQVVQVLRKFPYEHGMYPFAKLEHIPSGKYYSTSVIEDLIPIQREFNRTRSQIVEAKNRMAKPQLLAAKGSVDAKKITTEPGQVIYYNLGFPPPTPLQMAQLPGYVLESLTMLQGDFDDISSQHEVTRGQTPPQVTAATAISYLQEQDDSKLAHTIESLEDGIEKLGKMTLSYVSQYWNAKRLITIMGRDGAFEAYTYKGADLKGYNDVRVEAGSALQTSKAAKQAFIMDLMKNQLIPPDKGLELLDLAGVDRLYEDLQTDIRQAQRENMRMGVGQSLQINTWDNHQIHIDRHNQFRKSEAFEALPDQVKAIFEAHVQTHTAYVRQQQVQQQQQQVFGAAMNMGQNGNSSPGQMPQMQPSMGTGQPGGM